MKWLENIKAALGRGTKADADEPRPALDKRPGARDAPEAEPDTDALAVRTLTKRETQVFERLMTGARNRDIAAELGLKPDTVNGHCCSIYRKLGVHSKPRLISRYGRIERGGTEGDG